MTRFSVSKIANTYRNFLFILIALAVFSQNALCQELKIGDAKTTLAVWVDEAGKAKQIEIRKSCGQRNCDAAAMAVAMALLYVPVRDDPAQQKPRIFVIGVDVTESPQ